MSRVPILFSGCCKIYVITSGGRGALFACSFDGRLFWIEGRGYFVEPSGISKSVLLWCAVY